jgi:hypothetical protein
VDREIADVLRSFTSERGDDWPGPKLVPLVEFTINDSASSLGSGIGPATL